MSGATTSIGFVRSVGDFRVDGSVVHGNATVFPGDVIETAAARSVVQLNDGQLTLSPDSRAKVYSDRTVLEKGTGMLRETGKHVVEAGFLRVSPAAKDSVVQVGMDSTSHVTVFAYTGAAQVRNSSGLPLASLRPGMALAFDDPPQAGGSTAVKMTGAVSEQNGKFFITDSTTNVVAEIRGSDLAKSVGKKIQITGSIIPGATPAPPATEVVQVTNSKVLAAAAAGAAGGAVAAGLSTGATVAIVGGVVVAGTVGGLAAAGEFSGKAKVSTSPQ
jgi:hypothetical protein